MREITSSITKRGQVTVPVEVRRALGLRAPDRLVFIVDEETQTVRLEAPKYPDLDALAGAAGTLDAPTSWDNMRATAREDRLAKKLGTE